MIPLQRLFVIALLAMSGTALVACGEDASKKKLETINGEGFTAQMPGKAKRQTIDVQTAAGPVQVIAYISDGGEESFAVGVTEIPKGITPDLDGAIQGAAQKVSGTVAEKRTTTYDGYEARDARITNAKDDNGNKGTGFVRVLSAEGKLFQLQFIKAGGNVKTPPDVFKTFLNSLKIDKAAA
jgi:hypothetical protein